MTRKVDYSKTPLELATEEIKKLQSKLRGCNVQIKDLQKTLAIEREAKHKFFNQIKDLKADNEDLETQVQNLLSTGAKFK